MHTARALGFLALTIPAFWGAYLDNTAFKTVMAGAIVAVLTQLVKRIVGSASPWVGIITNALMSLSALFIATHYADMFSQVTIMQAIAIFVTAAGIHSTAKNFRYQVPDPSGDPIVRGTTATVLLLGMCLSLSMVGCVHPGAATVPANATAPLPAGAVDQVDATANKDLQAAHAFLATVASDVQSGKVTLSADQLRILDDADQAVNVASTAEKAYHNGGGGDASVLNAALAAAMKAFTAVQSSIGTGIK